MSSDIQSGNVATSSRWQPLAAIERRVLGVLIEKAKTTPENYPLSLNSIRAGCNQKSNRAPMMQLEEDQVEEALENLRKIGAISQIQGGGRVDKYRHLAYEWLAVEKVELAVMAELLLRGTQTVGELRGRAARMEPIKDLADLQPTLDSLHAKGLILYLSPPGRGSLVTHTLFLDRELDKVRRESGALDPEGAWGRAPASPEGTPTGGSPGAPPRPPAAASGQPHLPSLDELQQLRSELNDLKSELSAVRSDFDAALEQLRRDLEELNRQLGN